jgi:hypothetical protein
LESVLGKYFSSAAAKLIGEKSTVISYDDGFVGAGGLLGRPRGGSGLDGALQVAESELLGDHSPPPISAKFDLHAYQMP